MAIQLSNRSGTVIRTSDLTRISTTRYFSHKRTGNPLGNAASWNTGYNPFLLNVLLGISNVIVYNPWVATIGGYPPRTGTNGATPPLVPNGAEANWQNSTWQNYIPAGNYNLITVAFSNSTNFPLLNSGIIIDFDITDSYHYWDYTDTISGTYYSTTTPINMSDFTYEFVITYSDNTTDVYPCADGVLLPLPEGKIRHTTIKSIQVRAVLSSNQTTPQSSAPYNYRYSYVNFNINLFNFDIMFLGGFIQGGNDPLAGTKSYMDIAFSYLGARVTYSQKRRTQLNGNPRYADCSSYVGYCLGASGLGAFSITDYTGSLYSKLSGYNVGSNFLTAQYGDILLMSNTAGCPAGAESHAGFALGNGIILEVTGGAGSNNPNKNNTAQRYINKFTFRYICRI